MSKDDRVEVIDCDLCHGRHTVPDSDLRGYYETAPCPKCQDGTWAYKAMCLWYDKYHRLAATPTGEGM
jgi:hypothetical protein